MAATLHLQSAFAGLSLKSRQAPVAKKQPFISNGNAQKLSMKSRSSFQVEIVVGNDEPQDVALKRFRREVAGTGLVQEVRRRRYFENSVDMKKRKLKESRMKIKRSRQGRSFTKSYGQTYGQETAPFTDLFGTPDDIFADVLGSQDVLGSMAGMSMSDSVDFSR